MSQFAIFINQIEGVDLIIKALRNQQFEHGCIASSDLADGIEKNLCIMTEDGGMKPAQPPADVAADEPEKKKKFPKLKLV